MIQHDLHYFAGLLDGEGSITVGIDRHQGYDEYRPYIRIYNTNLEVLEWCKERFGGFIHTRDMSKYGKGWKISHSWNRGLRKNDKEWIQALSKILIIKKRQMKIMVKFLDCISERGRPLDPKMNAKKLQYREKIISLNNSVRSEIGRQQRLSEVGGE